jgi:hypothetical protein
MVGRWTRSCAVVLATCVVATFAVSVAAADPESVAVECCAGTDYEAVRAAVSARLPGSVVLVAAPDDQSASPRWSAQVCAEAQTGVSSLEDRVTGIVDQRTAPLPDETDLRYRVLANLVRAQIESALSDDRDDAEPEHGTEGFAAATEQPESSSASEPAPGSDQMLPVPWLALRLAMSFRASGNLGGKSQTPGIVLGPAIEVGVLAGRIWTAGFAVSPAGLVGGGSIPGVSLLFLSADVGVELALGRWTIGAALVTMAEHWDPNGPGVAQVWRWAVRVEGQTSVRIWDWLAIPVSIGVEASPTAVAFGHEFVDGVEIARELSRWRWMASIGLQLSFPLQD